MLKLWDGSVNFSTPEATNENWEQLVRLLYGKPIHEKPLLGKAPVYVRDGSVSPSSPVIGKYGGLKLAIMQGKPGLALYRKDFLDSCIAYADSLRVRERPVVDSLGERVLADCGQLKHLRNHIVDWVILEATANPTEEFAEELVDFLERLLELKSRPPEIGLWSDAWSEAHSLFLYETFLYVIAALLKTGDSRALHTIFTSHYLLPQTDRYGDGRFDTFDCLYASSETLQTLLTSEGKRLRSPTAELLKRQADREDLPFDEIIQAELLILLMVFIMPNILWYPQTLLCARRNIDYPFFIRATQHKGFKKLATITGIDDAEALRSAVKAGIERLEVSKWYNFHFNNDFWYSMNMEKIDTLK